MIITFRAFEMNWHASVSFDWLSKPVYMYIIKCTCVHIYIYILCVYVCVCVFNDVLTVCACVFMCVLNFVSLSKYVETPPNQA